MKLKLLLLSLLCLSLYSCKKETPVPMAITTSSESNEISFTSLSSTQTLDVTSTLPFTLQSGADWITLDSHDGKVGVNTFTLTSSSNTMLEDRNTTLTISGFDGANYLTKVIAITQSAT